MDWSGILSVFSPLPFHSIYSGPRRSILETQWQRAHLSIPPSAFLNFTALCALLISPLVFLCAFLSTSDAALSVGLFLTVFSLLLLCGYWIPSLLSRRYALMAESDLPMALRSIALHLSIKLAFEKALEHAAAAGYASSPLWAHALRQVQAGESVPRALALIADDVDSLAFSRAIHQLIVVYEEGVPPSSLIPLAEELTDQQLSATRMGASRMAMFGLLFIAVSCLIPAFFLILAVAAGPMVGFKTDPLTLALVYIVLLPLANAAVMGFTLLTSPSVAGSWRPAPLRAELQSKFKSLGMPAPSNSSLILFSLLLALVALSLSFLLSLGDSAFFFALLAAAIPFAVHALLEGQVMASVAALESELPNLLLVGASSGRFSLEKMLEQSSRAPAGPLREQSASALRQLRAGQNPMQVLSDWAARTPSTMLARALGLLSVGYKTGGHLSAALSATASDLLSSFMLVRERASLLSIQSYTLMAACGLLVPAILGVSLSFAAQIAPLQSQVGVLSPPSVALHSAPLPSSSQGIGILENSSEKASGADDSSFLISSGSGSAASSSSSGSSPSPSPISSLLSAAYFSIRIYLLLNAILCAFFLSLSQGARERFIHYALMLAVLSQAAWLFMAPAL